MTDIETLAAHPTLGLDKGRAYIIDGEAGGPYVIDGTRTRVRVATTTGAGAPVAQYPISWPYRVPPSGIFALGGTYPNMRFGLWDQGDGTEFFYSPFASGTPITNDSIDNPSEALALADPANGWRATSAGTIKSLRAEGLGTFADDGGGLVIAGLPGSTLQLKLYVNGALKATLTWAPGEFYVVKDAGALDEAFAIGDLIAFSLTATGLGPPAMGASGSSAVLVAQTIGIAWS